jgi:hypothetical protein
MPSRQKLLFGMVMFTVVLRLLPYLILQNHDHTTYPMAWFYPWNFMPLTALCLYSGATVANRWRSLAIPMFVLLFSDLCIWATTGDYRTAFPTDGWSVFVCYLLAVLLGQGLDKRSGPLKAFDALGRGILAEVIFFVVTNFAYFLVQTDYPHTSAGLIACYVAAIPFCVRSFLSTMFYSVLFFSPLTEMSAGTSRQPQPELNSTPIQ